MSNDLFCIRGGSASAAPRPYEDCGLDNIWLLDGFSVVKRQGEEIIEPEDIEGLHNAIALHLIRYRKALTGKEIRFIRRAIDMTQVELAHSLNTGQQTVARWEKDKVTMPGPEDRLLRITALLGLTDPDRFAELIREIPRSLNELDEGPSRKVGFTHNAHWTEAELIAA